jgi:hypothetical protein
VLIVYHIIYVFLSGIDSTAKVLAPSGESTLDNARLERIVESNNSSIDLARRRQARMLRMISGIDLVVCFVCCFKNVCKRYES